MSTMHILGNGFDLQHDLPTRFDPHLKDLAVKSEHFSGEWEYYGELGDLWSDVEEGLAFPCTDTFLNHLEYYAPDMASERESDRDAIIVVAEQLLNLPLKEFAERADESLNERAPLEIFQSIFRAGDHFLTFNYTHTLERLYGIEPSAILHVHGEVGGEPLILGYATGSLRELKELHEWDHEENYDHYRSTAYGVLEQKIHGFEKQYQIKRLTDFFERIPCPIDQVVVYGFSFGRVDKPYFVELSRLLRGATWTIYAHNEPALSDVSARFEDYALEFRYQAQVLSA